MLLSLPMVPLTVASLKCQHMSYLAYPRKNSSFWRIRCRHARRRLSRKHRRHLRARWSKARNIGFSERACSPLRSIAIGCSDRRRKVSRSPMSAGGGIEARKQSSSEQKKNIINDRTFKHTLWHGCSCTPEIRLREACNVTIGQSNVRGCFCTAILSNKSSFYPAHTGVYTIRNYCGWCRRRRSICN